MNAEGRISALPLCVWKQKFLIVSSSLIHIFIKKGGFVKVYIVANADGHVISSTDGRTWSDAFDAGIQIGKVAIGKRVIVYTRSDVEQDYAPLPGLYWTHAYDKTPTLSLGTDGACFNEVHYLGNQFVAVGFVEGSPRVPAFAYSADGIRWTMGVVDPAYIGMVGNGDDLVFNDVAYNGQGYLIVGSLSGSDFAGAFYTTDLSAGLYGPNWIDPESLPSDVNQLVFVPSTNFGFDGVWSAFSDDQKTWFSNTNLVPNGSWSAFGGSGGIDLTETLAVATGLSNLSIAEAASGFANGYFWWMVSTSEGQIIYWNHEPEGPWVNVPAPVQSAIKQAYVDGTSVYVLIQNFSGLTVDIEKITISGSVGIPELNGTYFAKYDRNSGGNVYKLQSDLAGTNVDGSGWSGLYVTNSATATWSHGTWIDALGYGDGHFYAGNDNDQVFRTNVMSPGSYVLLDPLNNSIWSKVDDRNDSFAYWNDVDYGVIRMESEAKPVKAGPTCLPCRKANGVLTCSKWKYFVANCPKGNMMCSGMSGAYVPAVTVCGQKLF